MVTCEYLTSRCVTPMTRKCAWVLLPVSVCQAEHQLVRHPHACVTHQVGRKVRGPGARALHVKKSQSISRLPTRMSLTKYFLAGSMFPLRSLAFSRIFLFPARNSLRILLNQVMFLFTDRSFPRFSFSPVIHISSMTKGPYLKHHFC
jgi:hypothetical protein